MLSEKDPPAGEPLKVMGIPEHPVTLDALTTGYGFTVMVRLFEVTLETLAQAALEFKTQVTICPFVSEALEKVGLLLPVFTPLICH